MAFREAIAVSWVEHETAQRESSSPVADAARTEASTGVLGVELAPWSFELSALIFWSRSLELGMLEYFAQKEKIWLKKTHFGASVRLQNPFLVQKNRRSRPLALA